MIFLAIGGSVGFQNTTSNYVVLTASVLVFLFSYMGFSVWAIWLGRVLTTTIRESAQRQAPRERTYGK